MCSSSWLVSLIYVFQFLGAGYIVSQCFIPIHPIIPSFIIFPLYHQQYQVLMNKK